VTPGHDAGQGQANLVFLAQQHLVEPANGGCQGGGHGGLFV
jgi:hypothetical protein